MTDPRRRADDDPRERGPEARPHEEDVHDRVDEASEESFPSSDPPAYGTPSVGSQNHS